MDTNKVIHVHLHEPYEGEQDYFFGCIKAIYDVLPKEAVGYACNTLYMRYNKSGYDYDTGKARIRTMPVHRKWQKKK